jgi:hypothetical protein
METVPVSIPTIEENVVKKISVSLLALLLISASAAFAQQEGVYSANALGYIKKTVPPEGKLACVTIPLHSLTDDTNVFGRTTLAQQMPAGSVVYFWNPETQVWSGGGKGVKGWSSAQSNRVVVAGEGFFLKSPADQTTPIPITFAGEVPSEATLSRAIVGGNAIATVGNPYPADFKFGTSTLASNAAAGSIVYFWNPTNQVWSGGGKSVKGWSSAQAERVVAATEAFFLKEAGSGLVWSPEKPYTWP